MASIIRHRWEVSIRSADGYEGQHGPIEVRFAPGAGSNGKRETVTLTALSFNALTVPSGAKAVAIILGTATSLTLRGISGDTGIALTPSSNPLGLDALLPLGSSPSIGIYNGSSSGQTVEVWWL